VREFVALSLVALLGACGGSPSPSAPAAPPSTAPPVPTATSAQLAGRVSWPGGRVHDAEVVILDGPNAGRKATTNNKGDYTFEGLAAGNTNVSVTAPEFEERRSGITLVNGTNTLDFDTQTLVPWRLSGFGNTVFDLPDYIGRVRIEGRWNGSRNSDFTVRFNGKRIINETLRNVGTYEGVHLTTGGGVMSIENSTYIIWTFSEERGQ
jgi:hypothetical protein